MTVTVQEMTNEILNCIKQYTEEASEKIAEVCKEESETLKENLKKDSPKGKRMGNKKYSRGWKIKKTSRSGYVQYEVYNTQGYLTHLLEKGHQNFVGTTKGKQKQVHTKGGRTPAYPHIKPNEEKAKETVERRIREVLQNG